MPSALTPNLEHLDWMRRHGIDPARTVTPVHITAAPTREQPRRVIVDYETVTFDDAGLIIGRVWHQILAPEPPPSPVDTTHYTTQCWHVASEHPAHADHCAAVTVWCVECQGPSDVVDESDEQIGFEEQAREVHVRRLDCGHDEVSPR